MNIPFYRYISGKDKEFFAEQLAIMLEAGLTLPRAIDVIYRQSRNPYFRDILEGVKKSLQQGRQLSQVLSLYPQVFPSEYLAVLKSGESTGRLGKVFKDLAAKQKEDNEYRRGILNALLYPALIVVAVILVGLYLVFAVIPNLAELFSQQSISLPWTTKTLVAIVAFINTYWFVIILIVMGLILGLRMYYKTSSGKLMISRVQLGIPVLKDLFEAEYVARFSHTLAMLTRYGVPIIEATNISRDTVKNVLFRRAIDNITSSLERGIPLSKPILEDPLFPPLLGQMVMVGEQTGKLDEALSNVADNYYREVASILKNLSTLVEPILIIIVGLGVAFMVFAILMPVYQIAQIT